MPFDGRAGVGVTFWMDVNIRVLKVGQWGLDDPGQACPLDHYAWSPPCPSYFDPKPPMWTPGTPEDRLITLYLKDTLLCSPCLQTIAAPFDDRYDHPHASRKR
jgi:hypothetical protein